MDIISFGDFQKLDIRIGTIKKAEVPEWSHAVMKLTVDFGDPPAGGEERCILFSLSEKVPPGTKVR